MPAKRYYITLAPIEHINGKLAPAALRCSNTDTPDAPANTYFYGYRRAASGDRSLFGVRSNPRNLNTNPYTADETTNRNLFTASLAVVRSNLAMDERRALAQSDFDCQTQYTTLQGYCVAAVRANNGIWLPQWIP